VSDDADEKSGASRCTSLHLHRVVLFKRTWQGLIWSRGPWAPSIHECPPCPVNCLKDASINGCKLGYWTNFNI
jgi:hypothetical protein